MFKYDVSIYIYYKLISTNLLQYVFRHNQSTSIEIRIKVMSLDSQEKVVTLTLRQLRKG